jgi:hypothetical protein
LDIRASETPGSYERIVYQTPLIPPLGAPQRLADELKSRYVLRIP